MNYIMQKKCGIKILSSASLIIQKSNLKKIMCVGVQCAMWLFFFVLNNKNARVHDFQNLAVQKIFQKLIHKGAFFPSRA